MNIGTLSKVKDIRELWKGEASDFTPWLAQENNISKLSDIINVELQVVQQEKDVGPFRADILCKSTLDNHNVLIENQLERTDHSHLGQILTYAAGLDAVTIIWIAKHFTEEHRAAIDWLNNITDEDFNFFGIEIEAYRIDNSLPAPFFQVVSKPNNWSKTVKSSSSEQGLTETKALNLEYWQAMKLYFEEKDSFLKHQKPQPQHWTSFALGRSNFSISAVVGFYYGYTKVEFNINTNNSKEHFNYLKNKYYHDSVSVFGENISWQELPDHKLSKVVLEKDMDPNIKTDWRNQHQWFLETIEKFDKFFRPKVKKI